ncbi:VWA domain-containing protein [candidate division KSB1 bacterium]|nr:VWA domain-containing protein [candidate division KSB1 bacterium]
MKKILLISLCVLISYIYTTESYCIGKLYGRIPWQENSPINNLDIISFSATVNVGDQMAVSRIVQEFSNASWWDLEGVFVYELPDDAKLTEFSIWRDGEKISYELQTLDGAAEIYEEIITREDDPLFPEKDSANILRMRLFPVKALSNFKVELTYVHLLPFENGDIAYNLPFDVSDYTVMPVRDIQIEINITSQYRIQKVASSFFDQLPEFSIEQLTPSNYKISLQTNNYLPDRDLAVTYALQTGTSYFNVLTYTPDDPSDDGYFTLWITPPDSLFQDTILVKEIVFAADLSSSMEGERLKQLKESLVYFIDRLNPVDWFNIIPFSTDVGVFRSDLVRASAEMKAAATTYISQFSAVGLTNIEGALSKALSHEFSYRNRRIIVLFTDGEPTAGITDYATILENVQTKNGDDVSIFTVGIGEAVDKTLLSMISDQNKGYAFFISSDDSLSSQLTDLYPRIIVPALTDLNVNYGAIQTFDMYPIRISNMVKGMQQVLRGRYRGTGEIMLNLTGNVGGTPVNLSSTVAFLANTNEYIGSLWAAGKIDHLLSLIKQHGEVQELVDAIVYLSKTYSILTPYTAFLLILPGEGRPPLDVGDAIPDLKPTAFELSQNYPNPFNPATRICYAIPGGNASLRHVSLNVFNTRGELVKTLVQAEQSPGRYVVEWDATDMTGRAVAGGVYYYHIESEGFSATKAMVLIK